MDQHLISWLLGEPQQGILSSNPIEIYTHPLPNQDVQNMSFDEIVHYERALANCEQNDEPWVYTEPVAE